MPRRHGDLVPGRKTYVNGHPVHQGSQQVFVTPGSPSYSRTALPRSPAYLSLATYDSRVTFQPPRSRHPPPQQAEQASSRRRASTDPEQRYAATTTSNRPATADAQRIEQFEAQLRQQHNIAQTKQSRLENQLSATRDTLDHTRQELDEANTNLGLAHMNARNLAAQITAHQQTEGRYRAERRIMIDDIQRYTTRLVAAVGDLQETRNELRTSQNLSLRLGLELMSEQRRRRAAQPAWASMERHRWESSENGNQEVANVSESPKSETVAGPSHDPHSKGGNSTTEQTQCAICMDENLEGDADANSWVVLPCGHAFHLGCVRHWHAQSFNCPFCRQEFEWRLARRRDDAAGDDGSEESEAGGNDDDGDSEGGGNDDAHGDAALVDIPGPAAGPWRLPIVPDRRLRTRMRRFWRRVTRRGRGD